MATLLEQLKGMTVVVADTGDIESMRKFLPRDATTNPSLIQQAAGMPEYAPIIDEALVWAKKEMGANASPIAVVKKAVDRLAVEFGLRILKIVPGRVSTEVDARLSFDTAATIEKAHSLIKMYEAAGTSRDRILIKIATTWEGVRAAEVLEKEGIHCNMTLLFGMHQAVACADAKATLISPFVGRILDWHKKEHNRDYPLRFEREVADVPEVIECHHIAGAYDYLLKVAVRDMDDYQRFVKEKLAALENIGRVQSHFVMTEVKNSTVLPVGGDVG